MAFLFPGADDGVGDASIADPPEAVVPDAPISEVAPAKFRTLEIPETPIFGMTSTTSTQSTPFGDVRALARRVKELESRQQSVEEKFVDDRLAGKFSSDGGPTAAQWTQMQDEMERVRRLFEFVESVLPTEPAEAMRFFNRSRADMKAPAWGEVRKDFGMAATEGRPLGLDVEMERYKSHVGKEVRKSQTAMHQEVSNCMQAIKALQRDVDIMRGGLLAARPRLDAQVPMVRKALLPPAAGGAAEGTGGTEEFEVPPAGQLVSRQYMQQEMSTLREELKSWLDQISENFQKSLRHKVDKHSLVDSDRGAAQRAMQGRAQQMGASDKAPDFQSEALRNNWRPSTSPGIKQLRAPGAGSCGPGGVRSLPKFEKSDAVRPFGQEPLKAMRQR